jgi:hypothetical protein
MRSDPSTDSQPVHPARERALEIHVTIDGASELRLRELLLHPGDFPVTASAKVTSVVLDTAEVNEQRMITWCDDTNTINAVLQQCESLTSWLFTKNVLVNRVKIESGINDARAVDAKYFELHLLIELPTQHRTALEKVAHAHNARMSRSARRQVGDDVVHVFVNKRCWGSDVDVAKVQFDELARTLHESKFSIVRSVEEAVLIDTNIELDCGWLTQSTRVS